MPRKRLVLPRVLREMVLRTYHLNGHWAAEKTFESIKTHYIWPSCFADTSDFVRACSGCQTAKNKGNKRNAMLRPQPISRGPFQKIQIDHLQLPRSGDLNYLFVIVDSFSGWTELIGTKSTGAYEAAQALLKYQYRHGAFNEVLSDRGSAFISALFKHLSELLGFDARVTSSRNPKSNGRCEKINRHIGYQLRILTGDKQQEWTRFIDVIQTSINTTKQANSALSAFELVYGRPYRTMIDDKILPRLEQEGSMEEFLDRHKTELQFFTKIAFENQLQANIQTKRKYDLRATEIEFKPGDKVLLSQWRHKRGDMKKLTRRFEGPYMITKILSNACVKLMNLENARVLRAPVHKDLLRPVYSEPSEFQSRNQHDRHAELPLMDEIEGGNTTGRHPVGDATEQRQRHTANTGRISAGATDRDAAS